MNKEQSDVVRIIDETFNVTSNQLQVLSELLEEHRTLSYRIHERREELKDTFIKLLCLVTADNHLFSGRVHKIPLIRLHRAAYASDLKSSKEAVERFIQPERVPFL
jgi:hypothetical protein